MVDFGISGVEHFGCTISHTSDTPPLKKSVQQAQMSGLYVRVATCSLDREVKVRDLAGGRQGNKQ
jgi:hypothetical protein